MPAVHQFLASLYTGDGMGNHALALQRLFRSWDFDSKIFASYLAPPAPPGCHLSASFDETLGPNDVAILHYGAYSSALRVFGRTKARKVLAYHNISPPRVFLDYSLRHYYETAIGRLELPQAVSVAAQCWTESFYNKRELDALGAHDCRVVPLLLEFDQLDAVEPDPGVLARYDDGVTNVLFVGRIVPHKKQENLISAFAQYQRNFNSRSRLLLVGRHRELDVYLDELLDHVRGLRLQDAVVFTGHITTAELAAYYRVARVFVSLSEHEGFGIPLVEAMHFGVPVVALARAAVPETLAGAGILINSLDFDAIATAIAHVCADQETRDSVLELQYRRLQDFAAPKVASTLSLYLRDLHA
jgi:glycosyltransferase involved in cell wall biosynthesis